MPAAGAGFAVGGGSGAATAVVADATPQFAVAPPPPPPHPRLAPPTPAAGAGSVAVAEPVPRAGVAVGSGAAAAIGADAAAAVAPAAAVASAKMRPAALRSMQAMIINRRTNAAGGDIDLMPQGPWPNLSAARADLNHWAKHKDGEGRGFHFVTEKSVKYAAAIEAMITKGKTPEAILRCWCHGKQTERPVEQANQLRVLRGTLRSS